MNPALPLPAGVAGGFEELAAAGRAVHLAIGMFDGVHTGHRAVVAGAVRAARADGGAAAVLTFDPHPSVILRPEAATRLLHPAWWRRRRLAECGVDAVVVQAFDAAFAAVEADDFPSWLRARVPLLRSVHVGANWRFGRGRVGDVDLLRLLGQRHGFGVVATPRVEAGGEPISSSRLRELVAAGRIEEANALLGEPYDSAGVVVPGRRLGRTIGYPTLNLPWEPEVAPRFGVYAVRVLAGLDPAGDGLPAVANYGVRPTVEAAGQPQLEVHVLGPCGGLDTGSLVRVRWLRFLREERRFASVDDLRAQIARDAAAARALLSA